VDGADHLRRPSMSARNRAQPLCRRQPADQRRISSRNSEIPIIPIPGVFSPTGAEIGSGDAGAQFLLARRHLPAGHQGHRGGDPFQARRDPAIGIPITGVVGTLASCRRRVTLSRPPRMPRPSRRRIPIISPSSPRPRCRSTTPPKSSPSEGTVSQHLRSAQGRHLLRHHQPPAPVKKVRRWSTP